MDDVLHSIMVRQPHIKLVSTEYSALPSPPRLVQHAVTARHTETIRSAVDTHADTQMLSNTKPPFTKR